uniref:DNA repair protein XRCC2 homolog n=1 Tax=Solanum tuberosum TaxID=4113 RepID=M1D419_SOLTU
MASSAREWIEADETAKQFLTRVFSERPFLPLPPPLHRIPLRPGNVVEIVGPSPSSKTRILMQAKYDKELFAVSMRRFLYIRCYDSFEFLATLKVS